MARSRRELPIVEFSDALRDRVVDLYPIAMTIKEFYDQHVHKVRLASSGLLVDAGHTARAVKRRRKRELRTLRARSTRALTRLTAALVKFEEEITRMADFAGATNPRGGKRANHVHLWIAGTLQGEADAFYEQDVRLPWAKIEDRLAIITKEPPRNRRYLALDVDRNRERSWFLDAREIGLASDAEWPQSTRLR